jgi:2-haloacid dehalogenase
VDSRCSVPAFDVFGRVADWHARSLARSMRCGRRIDGGDFALAWRRGYRAAMDRVRRGELGWTTVDIRYRMIRDELSMGS